MSVPPGQDEQEALDPATDVDAEVGLRLSRAMRYPDAYAWLIFASALDVMLTWRILEGGGFEINPIARFVIDMWALPGAIVFKFGLMLFVIMACEIVGRHKDRAGRLLAGCAVLVSAIPVVYSLGLLTHRMVVELG
jgi:hypothetical protein